MSILLYQRSEHDILDSILAYYNYDLHCYIGFQVQTRNLPVYNLQQNPNHPYAIQSLQYHLENHFYLSFQIFSANQEKQNLNFYFPNQQSISFKKQGNAYIGNGTEWQSYEFPASIKKEEYQSYCNFILQMILKTTALSYEQLLIFYQHNILPHNQFKKFFCIAINDLKETWFSCQTDISDKSQIIILPYQYQIPTNIDENTTFIRLLYDDIQRQRIMTTPSLKLGILENNNSPLSPVTLFSPNNTTQEGTLDSSSLKCQIGQYTYLFTQQFLNNPLTEELLYEWDHIIAVLLYQPFQNVSDQYKQLLLTKQPKCSQ